MADQQQPVLFLQAVDRRYPQGDATLEILKGAEFGAWLGQSVALVAPSGTGKSTLLHIAGLLEHPDGGEVYVDGVATSHLSDIERTRIRRTEMGFVYQAHHLLPEFSALENVMMPQMIRGLSRKRGAKPRDRTAGLSRPEGARHASAGGIVRRRAAARRDRARHGQCAAHPSGRRADRQSRSAYRAACVRHADQLVRASGLAAIIATHNLELARRMDRRVTIQEGDGGGNGVTRGGRSRSCDRLRHRGDARGAVRGRRPWRRVPES